MTMLFLKWAGILGGWALAAAAGWTALHEYHIASTQASRDKASYAIAQEHATAKALKKQQAIDAIQQNKLVAMAQRAQHYAQIQQQIAQSAVHNETVARLQLERYATSQPITACINQKLPAPVQQAVGR